MPKKILIVEDEDDYRSLISHLLGKKGYAVVTAANGEEGLKAYAEEKPDLVVLDVRLPDMDGFEICRKIRADGPRPDTPIIFCTVRSAVARVSEGLRSGGTDYVVKPFEIEDLLSRVKAALSPEEA
ncbi:MAG: response regulator [Elusimicrobiota bacterium]